MNEWPTLDEAEKRSKELMAEGKRTLVLAGLCPICGSGLNHHHWPEDSQSDRGADDQRR